jgi:hypothetical protein
MAKLNRQIKKYNIIISKLIEIILKLKQEHQVKLLKYAEELLIEDKRSSVRKACEIPINFASQNQIFTDQIKDISKSGLFIETTKPLFIGERVIMSFNMNGYDRPFKIRGEIVHANRSGVGVEYREISPYLVDMIGALVDRIQD